MFPHAHLSAYMYYYASCSCWWRAAAAAACTRTCCSHFTGFWGIMWTRGRGCMLRRHSARGIGDRGARRGSGLVKHSARSLIDTRIQVQNLSDMRCAAAFVQPRHLLSRHRIAASCMRLWLQMLLCNSTARALARNCSTPPCMHPPPAAITEPLPRQARPPRSRPSPPPTAARRRCWWASGRRRCRAAGS